MGRAEAWVEVGETNVTGPPCWTTAWRGRHNAPMTKRKRNPLLTVAGRAGTAAVRGLVPVITTTAAAGALAGVVALPLGKYIKSLDSVY